MTDYQVKFSKSMDGVTFDQQTEIADFLKATIETDYNNDSAQWKVTTAKDLTTKLMNTALAKAGILKITTISVDEI